MVDLMLGFNLSDIPTNSASEELFVTIVCLVEALSIDPVPKALTAPVVPFPSECTPNDESTNEFNTNSPSDRVLTSDLELHLGTQQLFLVFYCRQADTFELW
jgi:hypothetical protein